MATGKRVDTGYRHARDAFEDIWTQKSLPVDARLYICGAVWGGGRRQGEEVFPREIMERIAVGTKLDPDEQLELFEAVHKYVLVDSRLRDQYVTIVLKMAVDYLNEKHGALARDLQDQIAEQASRN